jgi:hypothetical protein
LENNTPLLCSPWYGWDQAKPRFALSWDKT